MPTSMLAKKSCNDVINDSIIFVLIYIFYFRQVVLLPLNASQARREFGSGGFMMCDARATKSVPRTVFRTRAIYVIIWTGHISN